MPPICKEIVVEGDSKRECGQNADWLLCQPTGNIKNNCLYLCKIHGALRSLKDGVPIGRRPATLCHYETCWNLRSGNSGYCHKHNQENLVKTPTMCQEDICLVSKSYVHPYDYPETKRKEFCAHHAAKANGWTIIPPVLLDIHLDVKTRLCQKGICGRTQAYVKETSRPGFPSYWCLSCAASEKMLRNREFTFDSDLPQGYRMTMQEVKDDDCWGKRWERIKQFDVDQWIRLADLEDTQSEEKFDDYRSNEHSNNQFDNMKAAVERYRKERNHPPLCLLLLKECHKGNISWVEAGYKVLFPITEAELELDAIHQGRYGGALRILESKEIREVLRNEIAKDSACYIIHRGALSFKNDHRERLSLAMWEALKMPMTNKPRSVVFSVQLKEYYEPQRPGENLRQEEHDEQNIGKMLWFVKSPSDEKERVVIKSEDLLTAKKTKRSRKAKHESFDADSY